MPSDPAPQAIPLGRDEKIEELLLTGLDLYFDGQYEQAINVWTRVLFLDRSHTRARAYIERARGALGEQQRESEELLHNGLAALERGEVRVARELLQSAIERGGAREDALAVLERLARLEAASGAPERGRGGSRDDRRAAPVRLPRDAEGTRRRLSWTPLVILVGLGLAAYYIWTVRASLPDGFLPARPAVDASAPAGREDPLPQPSIAELALARARALYERGRLNEALRALDEIGVGDPLRSEADKLRGTIQQLLLAATAIVGAPSGNR